VSDLVFVTAIWTTVDPNNFSRRFVTWCTAAGVPRVRLHDLRHTCVSLLLSRSEPPGGDGDRRNTRHRR